jgi:hypothetical protein
MFKEESYSYVMVKCVDRMSKGEVEKCLANTVGRQLMTMDKTTEHRMGE